MAKLMRKALSFVAAILWVYSYISLGFMMAIAATPGFLLAKLFWSAEFVRVGPTWVSETLQALWGLYGSILAFFLFGICLMGLIPVVRKLFGFKPHVGEIPIRNFRIWSWYNVNGMQFMFNTVYGRFARTTSLYPHFLRAMGAKIGKRSVVNTHHIYDCDLIEIGDDTVIGANASILGHVGEKNKLVRAPVKIGSRCTVGQYTNIFPGVTIPDNCHVGAMSLVPKGMTLEPNSIWGGIPVRKLRDLDAAGKPE